MSTKIRHITLTVLSGFAVVLVLYLIQGNRAPERHGFTRAFQHDVLGQPAVLDLGFNSYYIAGIDSTSLYFGNSTAARRILKSDLKLQDTSHHIIQYGDTTTYPFRSIRVEVLPPYFYYADGTIPVIKRGSSEDWRITETYSPKTYFDLYKVIDTTKFILRSLHADTDEIRLHLFDRDTLATRALHHLATGPGWGIFGMDGRLSVDSESDHIFYQFYYWNALLVLDTALHVENQWASLDSITAPQIKTETIRSSGETTMAAPPLKVNNQAQVDGRWLFVQSALMGQQENPVSFNGSVVIDVYDWHNGHYVFSFYLPNYGGKPSREYRIHEGQLISLHDTYAVAYPIANDYFNSRDTTKLLANNQGNAENL